MTPGYGYGAFTPFGGIQGGIMETQNTMLMLVLMPIILLAVVIVAIGAIRIAKSLKREAV